METNYPGLLHRVKAVMIDSIVLIVFMIIITNVFAIFETVPDTARLIAFLFIFVLYDPFFTSSIGGTLGHMIIGIRVKRENNDQKNIQLPKAIIRFATKVLLGWISFLTVTSNNKNKAIHDSIVGSIVIFK